MDAIIETHNESLVKKHDTKRTISSLLILVLGAAMLITAILTMQETTSAIYLTLVTFGVVFILFAVIRILSAGKQVIYKPTGSEVRKHAVYFKSDEVQKLIYSIETANFAILPSILGDNNSGVRLDVYMSRDGKYAACQVFKYIPYNYEAASTVYCIEDKNRGSFCDQIKSLLTPRTARAQ